MREVVFVKKNEEKWKLSERNISDLTPDELAENFIALTDDLAYARTFYPNSNTERYLNALSAQFHRLIYKNKKEKSGRFRVFWKYEVPLTIRKHHTKLFYSFLFFFISGIIGAFSTAKDETFVRLILGDSYVNQTIENIESGDPMAVYKSGGSTYSFLAITLNNIRVSFMTFVAGILFSAGTVWLLFYNGVMLGSFQYFFYEKGVLWDSLMSVWIHGTLEISAIIIAGGAGITLGNSILFPKTYSRFKSFTQGAKDGIKILVGLIPVFIVAGFLEGFVTRYTDMPDWVSLTIILSSLTFVVYYFIVYPYFLDKKNKKHEENI